jgi:hypothetical protein
MMNAERFHELLRSQPFRPFRVKTTDGDTFEVDHPDYAMVSRDDTDVAIYDKDNHFRLVAMDHIVSLEPVRSNGSKKPGKR